MILKEIFQLFSPEWKYYPLFQKKAFQNEWMIFYFKMPHKQNFCFVIIMLAWIFGAENQHKIRHRAIRKLHQIFHQNPLSQNQTFILVVPQKISIFEKWRAKTQKFSEKYQRIHLSSIHHIRWSKMSELLGM